ncbi:MAG TPA: purine-nucleoside phosphorylase [Polyangiaceae bacterium]|nr:purine-nucleoside phosphorylase [Polyangiaceae bacterium]
MLDRIRRDRAALKEATDLVKKRSPLQPSLGLVLGSGLGHLANTLERASVIPYSEIPSMPTPSVAGHSGRLSIGVLGGVTTACLEGRVHLYEGHEPEDVVFGVRLLAELGCSSVLLTNAAGGTTEKMPPGALMLIRDHINLTGRNPLVGWNRPAAFIDMSDAYDPRLADQALAAANEMGITLHQGVYAGLTGPSYETKAEVAHLARIGADAVGMSTVLETIALRERGVRVIAMSCITNLAAGVPGAVLDHGHVQQVAQRAAGQLETLILQWVQGAFGGTAAQSN